MSIVNVVVDNYLRVTLKEISTACEVELRRYLTYKNPELAMKRNIGAPTKGIPTVLKLFRYDREIDPITMLLDRGCYHTLVHCFSRFGYTAKLKDNRASSPIKMPEFKLVLEDYQLKAVTEIVSGKHQGIIVFPTGTGKTVTAIALASALNQKTLILVHTKDLMDQWVRSIKGLQSGVDVDTWSGDHKSIGAQYTVATVQSLFTPMTEGWYRQFGLVIQDESHHAPAECFQKVIGSFPAKFRYGFTATPKRRDGKSFFMHSLFGDILAEIDYSDAGDRIIMPTIFPIVARHCPHQYEGIYRMIRGGDEVLNYVEVYTRMVKDNVRNNQILDLVAELQGEEGNHTLLLTKRREHAQEIRDFLNLHGIPTETVLGGGSKKYQKEKAATLERARDGSLKVLVGTSVADEGLDILVLNNLLLTLPSSWSGILQQRMGRIMRNHDGKKVPRVFDFVDTHIPEFLDSWKKRLRFYKSMAFSVDYSKCIGSVIDPNKDR
jgi:superfamily II DNA or RNA helicase